MRLALCTLFALLLHLPYSQAGDEGFTMPLFNGVDLSGWHVTRCEAGVEDGKLVLQSGNGFVRADHRYGDFVLELDWKARLDQKYDSGIYFRSELPGETGRPWPTRYQVNLAQGDEGNIKTVPGAASTGLIRPGEWNHFKLTAIGHTASLEINGQQAWTTDKIEPTEGYIGLQAEVPIGGQFEFRNIRITELGYVSLLADADLAGTDGRGWEPGNPLPPTCWKLAGGVLECNGERGPWLRSGRQYGDFNLRLEYKLTPGGNSGVFVRVPREGAHRGRELADGPSGIEVQLLDDAHEKHANIEPAQFAGSLYALDPASKHVSRPAGSWNTIEIDCRGTHYRVVHNGVVVIDADADRVPELNDREKHGYLGLQDHRSPVAFRNIRVQAADSK